MPIYATQFNIADEQGRSVSRTILFDVADEAALLVALGTYVPAYQALMKCGIVDYTYRRQVLVNNAPAAGSNVDAGFTTLWATPLPIDPTTKVPDPVEAIKDGQGSIDIANLLMTTWFAEFNPGSCRVNVNSPQQPTAIRRATLDK